LTIRSDTPDNSQPSKMPYVLMDIVVICERCNFHKSVKTERARALVERLHTKKCPKTGRTISKASIKVDVRRQLAGKDPVNCDAIHDNTGLVLEPTKNVIDISSTDISVADIKRLLAKEIARGLRGKKGFTIRHAEFSLVQTNGGRWLTKTHDGKPNLLAERLLRELGLRKVVKDPIQTLCTQ